MSLFCLLYIPLLYFIRQRPSKGDENLWALPLGAAAVILRYLFGPLVTPGAFGFSRWVSGLIDVVGLPALLAFVVCGVLAALRVIPRDVDYTGFALLWLIPPAAIQAVSNVPPTPIPLIVVPLLWSAQVLGISFFINNMTRNPRGHIVFFSTLAIAVLPIAAVTSWWAFFAQQPLLGSLLLVVTSIPAALSITAKGEAEDSKYVEILDLYN